MQVRDVMTRRPHYLSADATIREAAELMRKNNSGFEPLARGDRIIGTLTDRDITIRAVAEGKSAEDKATSIATDRVLYTYEEDDVVDVLNNMQEQKVQRLVVLNNVNDKRFTGVVTVGDIADRCDDEAILHELVECTRHYH